MVGKKKGLFWVMSLGSGEVGMLEGVGLKVARDKTLYISLVDLFDYIMRKYLLKILIKTEELLCPAFPGLGNN